jgi:hypothetical protein
MDEGFDEIVEVLPFLIPLLIIQIVLMVIALVDLVKRDRVRGENKVVWALVIVLINVIGPIVYLVAGRQEGSDSGDQR